MHPIPSAPSKRALRGLGGLLLGSLLLLGPGQVAADHDLTCHEPPRRLPFILHDQVERDAPGPLVLSATPRDDRTGEEMEHRPRTIQSPSDQDGPTTPAVTLAATPAAARSC
jgi:hypothetical protein